MNAIDCIIFVFFFEMSLQLSYFVHSHFVLCLNKNFSNITLFSIGSVLKSKEVNIFRILRIKNPKKIQYNY